jgi:hypothetical protein
MSQLQNGNGSSLTGVVASAVVVTGIVFNAAGLTAYESFDDTALGVPSAGSLTNGFGWQRSATFTNAIVKTLTFADAMADHYIEITNGFWSRRMSISNNWRILRVMIQWSVTPNGNADIGGCLFALGASSSAGPGYEGFKTGSCSNFFGWVSCSADFTNGQSIGRATLSGTNAYYQNNVDRGAYITISSGVATNKTVAIASGGAFLVPFNSQGNAWPRRFPVQMLMDGQTNLMGETLVAVSTSTFVMEDFDQQRVFEQVTQSRNTTIVDNSLTASSTLSTINPLKSPALDSVNIFWNNPTNAIQIYSVMVKAFY